MSVRSSRDMKKRKMMKYFDAWNKYFLQATDLDRWKMTSEAIVAYNDFSKELESFINNDEFSPNEVKFQKETCRKMLLCIKARTEILEEGNNQEWPQLEVLMKIKPVLRDFLTWKRVFPILVVPRTLSKTSVASQDSGLDVRENISSDDEDHCSYVSLFKRLPKIAKLHRIAIKVEKIGLKFPRNLYKPYLTISLRDKDSVNLTSLINTPCTRTIRDFHLEFNCQLEVQQYLEKIPPKSALFFELNHTTSGRKETKCYAVLPREQFTAKNVYLELYEGPTDFHLKRAKKLSKKKPLYLHLELLQLDESA